MESLIPGGLIVLPAPKYMPQMLIYAKRKAYMKPVNNTALIYLPGVAANTQQGFLFWATSHVPTTVIVINWESPI